MSLADDIRERGRRAIAGLNAVKLYHFDSVRAWEFIHRSAARNGRRPMGLPDSEAVTLGEVAERSRNYVSLYLKQATFNQSLSVFESLFFDLLALWLAAHPRSVGNKTFDLKTALDAGSIDELVAAAVRRELNNVLYLRPAEWFDYLNGKVKVGVPSDAEIARFAEAKASRDALLHNAGVVGKQYLDKSGALARYELGEYIDLPDDYHLDTLQLLIKIVGDLTDSVAAKA